MKIFITRKSQPWQVKKLRLHPAGWAGPTHQPAKWQGSQNSQWFVEGFDGYWQIIKTQVLNSQVYWVYQSKLFQLQAVPHWGIKGDSLPQNVFFCFSELFSLYRSLLCRCTGTWVSSTSPYSAPVHKLSRRRPVTSTVKREEDGAVFLKDDPVPGSWTALWRPEREGMAEGREQGYIRIWKQAMFKVQPKIFRKCQVYRELLRPTYGPSTGPSFKQV